MAYSNCCGAYTVETDYGICPECKEHCVFEEKCNNCDGIGEIDGIVCLECDGTGFIEE